MPKQNALPTWAHGDLDTLITILKDGIDKLRATRDSDDLTRSTRHDLDRAFDDFRLAHAFAKKMRERQEDIVELDGEHAETRVE